MISLGLDWFLGGRDVGGWILEGDILSTECIYKCLGAGVIDNMSLLSLLLFCNSLLFLWVDPLKLLF